MLLSVSKIHDETEQPSLPWAPRAREPWAWLGDSAHCRGRGPARSAEQNAETTEGRCLWLKLWH